MRIHCVRYYPITLKVEELNKGKVKNIQKQIVLGRWQMSSTPEKKVSFLFCIFTQNVIENCILGKFFSPFLTFLLEMYYLRKVPWCLQSLIFVSQLCSSHPWKRKLKIGQKQNYEQQGGNMGVKKHSCWCRQRLPCQSRSAPAEDIRNPLTDLNNRF